jgi:hypothetical protein
MQATRGADTGDGGVRTARGVQGVDAVRRRRSTVCTHASDRGVHAKSGGSTPAAKERGCGARRHQEVGGDDGEVSEGRTTASQGLALEKCPTPTFFCS